MQEAVLPSVVAALHPKPFLLVISYRFDCLLLSLCATVFRLSTSTKVKEKANKPHVLAVFCTGSCCYDTVYMST